MRLPRFFAKKRGHRRTGSREWGVVGDGLFHGILLAAGLFFGGLLISGVAAPEWRINHDYVESRCTILAKGLAKTAVQDPSGAVSTTWQPRLRVRYTAGGRVYEAWSQGTSAEATTDRTTALARLSRWILGSQTACWYDPTAPETVVLERGYNWWLWLLALLLPGALVVIGGSGLVRVLRAWGKSEERRAASAGLAEFLDPLMHPAPTAPGHPAVPNCDDLVNSPGTILRYRLPIESPESWTLVGFGLFAVLWNAVLLVLAVGAGLDLLGGKIDWWLFVLLVPFLGVGIGGVVLFMRNLFLATVVGPTQVEISDHPLRPGRRYDVLLAQGGAGTFRRLQMFLELEEQATFRQGTDTRTEQVVVWRSLVTDCRDAAPAPNARFESWSVMEIPPDAMHSFSSAHNAVRWRLVVRGTTDRCPDFTRVFPVVVFPAEVMPAPIAEQRRAQTEMAG